jgi:hypothetical protein
VIESRDVRSGWLTLPGESRTLWTKVSALYIGACSFPGFILATARTRSARRRALWGSGSFSDRRIHYANLRFAHAVVSNRVAYDTGPTALIPPAITGLLLTAHGTLTTRATEGTPTTLSKRRTRASGGYCESSYDAAGARQQSVRKETTAVFEVIESIKAAARPAHFRRILMFAFVMAPQDRRYGSHGKSRFAPLATPRFFSHSQKSIRHNDLDADEPLGN